MAERIEIKGVSLSPRESEVFRHCSNGLMAKEITSEMQVSPKTVESWKDRIKAKLGIKTTAELIHVATKWSLGSRCVSVLLHGSGEDGDPQVPVGCYSSYEKAKEAESRLAESRGVMIDYGTAIEQFVVDVDEF